MVAVVVLATGCGGGQSLSPALVSIGAGLKGPSGLHATVYATGLPLMSAFAFDARGRLWVATSGATTHATDGVFVVPRPGARPIRVVSALRGPLGLVWVGDRLIVSSLGRVTAFGGLSGSRFTTRKTIVQGPVAAGENNNVARAPDGRLVMRVSSTCDHCVPPSKWAATIVRFRPDGSGLGVLARGIRAAYGVDFLPGTGDLFASMNQRDDLGAKTPGDWLGLVRPGQDWGFPACYGQQTAACKAYPAPAAVLDPHAAAGSVAILTTQLGGVFNPSALVSEWQLGKVQRVALTRTGSGYKGTAQPFLTGIQRPLPLLTTPDGALLVGDWETGKIYRITGS